MSTRRSGRSRSQSRSRRDEEEAGSEPAPAPSPARLAGSESESEFEESQEADERVLERAEELEKIKEQQRETREGLAALRQRFEDQGAAAAESQAEVKGLLQQLLAGSGTSAGSVAGGGTAREAQGEDGVRGRIESAPAAGDQEALAREEEGEDRAAAAVRSRSVRPRAREEAARLEAKEAELVSLEADLKAKAEEVLRLKLRQRGEEPGVADEVFAFAGTKADFLGFVERAFEVSCSEESLLEQEALLATEYAPFVEERYAWSSKLQAREAARFRNSQLSGVPPQALVFPAQGVPFVPLAADLQEAAPGALGLPEGSLRELIVLWPVVARFSDVRRYLAPREGGSAAASSVRPSLSVADRRVVALRDLQACEQILRERLEGILMRARAKANFPQRNGSVESEELVTLRVELAAAKWSPEIGFSLEEQKLREAELKKEVEEFKKEGAKQKAKDQAAAAKEAAKARKKGGAGHGGFRAWSSDPRG